MGRGTSKAGGGGGSSAGGTTAQAKAILQAKTQKDVKSAMNDAPKGTLLTYDTPRSEIVYEKVADNSEGGTWGITQFLKEGGMTTNLIRGAKAVREIQTNNKAFGSNANDNALIKKYKRQDSFDRRLSGGV